MNTTHPTSAPTRTVPGFVLAAVSSGAGKTTLATGLMAALTARGLRVQPFKVGPDYIDPSYHTAVTGRPSRNLDGWLVGEAATRELYARAVSGMDIAVVEGVMGLFDGRAGGGEAGSTAQAAKLLGLPVILVIDAAKLARSAGAIALGYRRFDPALNLAGVILNRVASDRHAATLRDAVEREAGVPVLGTVPKLPDVALPERYLGLIPVVEGRTAEDFFAAARHAAESHINLDRLLDLAAQARLPKPPADAPPSRLFPPTPVPTRARIAVAQDRAFSFYYPDSLDLLRAWGAELVPFSPLSDTALPPDTGAVYLGGGFPELFAAELAANAPLHAALRAAADRGIPIYGECGGLMYLGQALTDAEGVRHAMTGLLPLSSTMQRAKLTLAYWDLTIRVTGPLGPAGQRLRGHEFHWSIPDRAPSPDEALYALEDVDRLEGFRSGSVSGSYIHLHFGSDPGLAPAFVQAAAVAGKGAA